jgi:hypothetical protein
MQINCITNFIKKTSGKWQPILSNATRQNTNDWHLNLVARLAILES